jgi:menaquinol-cytochrome c reductase iron-sulfur subunit
MYLMGGLVGIGLTLPALAYLLLPSKKAGRSVWTDAGKLDAIPDTEPTQLVVLREKADGWSKSFEPTSVWVVREGADVTAFSPQCPHLGCGYRWVDDQEHFLCPCHDSTFSIEGEVLTGPSPRALDRYDVRVEGDRLWLGQVRKSSEV